MRIAMTTDERVARVQGALREAGSIPPIARRSGLPEKTVYRWRAGSIRDPRHRTLVALEEALGLATPGYPNRPHDLGHRVAAVLAVPTSLSLAAHPPTGGLIRATEHLFRAIA